MVDSAKIEARKTLDDYLERGNHRKTPERYAILGAVYDLHGHFTLDELAAVLADRSFRVSRATIYNAIRLFLKLRLVVRHRLMDGTRYEASLRKGGHIHQVCTVCGKVSEIEMARVSQLLDEYKFRRFRKDGYTLYIYGICSRCIGKTNKLLAVPNKENNQ